MEFEFRPDGKLRYANNSNYKNDTLIRKECYVGNAVMEELKRIIDDSEIMNVRFIIKVANAWQDRTLKIGKKFNFEARVCVITQKPCKY